MKTYLSTYLKLLLLFCFLIRVDFVSGQEKYRAKEKNNKAAVLRNDDTLALADNAASNQYLANLPQSDTSTEGKTGNKSTATSDVTKAKSQSKSDNNLTRSFTLGAETEFERLTLKALPKAFSSKTYLSFALRHDGNYKLEILDRNGAFVTVLAEGAGQTNEKFAFLFKKGRFPAGAYIGRLITAEEVTSVRFILE
ncbi:hypothetical protein [Pontibacter vulgaris]|uniref:hypothetical protein n=1 Tax=Pontibacter vulgaris TaxID=2905679 RepID=UPI001FA813A0|nr:hypothetical protein [Pontibacter vulgaris]